ncbi:MAG: hypothetical protein J6A89_06770 [Clostridia bacterium]|nr:hypothetical protein [Clostridia bacterium]
MDKKTTGIVGYLTWIGFIIAVCAGDKEGAKFHLNQSLLIQIGFTIGSVLMMIPIIRWIFGIAWTLICLAGWFLGLIAAINEEEKEIPFVGQIKLLK